MREPSDNNLKRVIDLCVKITSDPRFEEDRTCRANINYTNIWVEYAGLVKDPKSVYEYMVSRGIG